jgi:predicted nucleic acid-binding protein
VRGFNRALGAAERIGVDTSVLIYHLEDLAPYAELTTFLIARGASGRASLIVSTVTIAEVLAGAWRTGDPARARRVEATLRAMPWGKVADVTWDAAARGAELRGRLRLPMPDALIIASTVAAGAQRLVTNDAEWRTRRLPCPVVVLDDFVG